MRVLALGAGAIGGYYGARLIEVGHEVTFLVRPARAAALAQCGLRIHGGAADFSQAVRAITSTPRGECFDLVILACKAPDLDAAIAAIAPAVGAKTRVLPLLNGLRHLDALDRAFGADRVLGGVCHISVTLDDTRAIRQFGTLDRLTFGSRDGAQPVSATIVDGLCALGPSAIHSAEILGAMWQKFVFIAALAGVTCLLRGSIGSIVAAGGAPLAQRLYAECAQVAACSAHPMPPTVVAEAAHFLTTPNSPLKASMLRDLERGARTEAEHILGDMHARAEIHSIDAPLLAAALAQLRIREAERATAARA